MVLYIVPLDINSPILRTEPLKYSAESESLYDLKEKSCKQFNLKPEKYLTTSTSNYEIKAYYFLKVNYYF